MRFLGVAAVVALTTLPALAQDNTLPVFLRDRGPGVTTSMFGTYVQRGEWLVYPFYEYYHDDDLEYAPEEFGAVGDKDFEGKYRANEALLWVTHGLTEDLAVEFEIAVIDAHFEKSPLDTSSLPAKIDESGLGDVEGQIRWRWHRETEQAPELFSYAEVVFPHAKNKVLIGTPGWEVKLGTGATRGFRWGTMTARASIEYDQASSSKLDVGELAIEYLKRISRKWRVVAAIEGTADELSLITELQWQPRRGITLKLNNGLGLTAKATDWAPEIGILFTIPARGAR